MVSSVFYLNQTADPLEVAGRLRMLVDVLIGMTPEQFRQMTVWLKNVSKSELPEPLREEVDRVLDETKPREAEKMITNFERALHKMKRQALMEGRVEDKAEGKAEVARALLKKGFTVDDIVELTGLSRETVLEIKKGLEN